jgi:hypothetical protein
MDLQLIDINTLITALKLLTCSFLVCRITSFEKKKGWLKGNFSLDWEVKSDTDMKE